MRRHLLALPLATLVLLGTLSPAMAQDSTDQTQQADPTLYPPVVQVARIAGGFRYVTPQGRTLYMLDPRDARGRGGTVIDYCIARCATLFTPVAAAANAVPVGLWKPQTSKLGPVWTYRGSPVFTYRDDQKPGDTRGDGWDDIIHTIEWVPPKPVVAAPAPATPVYVAGRWLLADGKDHLLFTANCATPCAASPLRAGLAARSGKEWSVISGEDGPQWAYRRRPVWLSPSATALPQLAGAEPIEAHNP